MQFLDELNTRRQPDESCTSQGSDVTGGSEIESEDMSRPGTSHSGPSMSSKRKKHTDEVGTMIEYFEKRRRDTAVDHIDQLFLSYAHTFKHMPSRTQITIKLKMAQLFAEAEIEDPNSRDTILARDINSRTSTAEEINAVTPLTEEINAETPTAEEVNAETSIYIYSDENITQYLTLYRISCQIWNTS